MKEYTVTGCCWYLTNFTLNIEAKNKKEALKLAKQQENYVKDPAMSECIEVVFDKPHLKKQP